MRRPLISGIAALSIFVGMLAAHDFYADEPMRRGEKLIVAGGVFLGASYTASFGMTAAIGFAYPIESGDPICQHNRSGAGFVPLVGPWVQLGYEHETADVVALFTVPGVVQVGGLAMMLAGGILELRAGRSVQTRR